jgi:hypothetical protein
MTATAGQAMWGIQDPVSASALPIAAAAAAAAPTP